MYLATPLSSKDTNSISEVDLGHNWFTEFTNTVSHLHNHQLTKIKSSRKLLSDKYMKQCIQSPFTTREKVSIYTAELTWNKNKKRNIDLISIHRQIEDGPLPSNRSIPSCDNDRIT